MDTVAIRGYRKPCRRSFDRSLVIQAQGIRPGYEPRPASRPPAVTRTAAAQKQAIR